MRQFVSSDSQSCWKCKARETQGDVSPVKMDSISAVLLDMKTRVTAVSSDVMTDLWQPGQMWTNVRPHLTLTNVTQLGKLCVVLMLAAVTGAAAGVKQLGQFSLKLLHELANLVDRSTPLALAALNMMGKIVGGAYLLIAMIWRDAVKKPAGNTGQAPPAPRPAVTMSHQAAGPAGRAAAGAGDMTYRRPGTRPPDTDHRAAMDHVYSQGRNW